MATVLLFLFDTVSSGVKNQSSLVSSGSQQNRANSSLSNSLSSAVSYDNKTEHKEPVSKSGKRFNHGSSGRQYQVPGVVFSYAFCRSFVTKLLFIFHFVVLSLALSIETWLIN